MDPWFWRDLAKDCRLSAVLALIEELINSKTMEPILPRIAIDEFVPNRDKMVEQGQRSLASHTKRAKPSQSSAMGTGGQRMEGRISEAAQAGAGPNCRVTTVGLRRIVPETYLSSWSWWSRRTQRGSRMGIVQSRNCAIGMIVLRMFLGSDCSSKCWCLRWRAPMGRQVATDVPGDPCGC